MKILLTGKLLKMSKRDYSSNYRKVMKEVKLRDNFSCQFPNCKKRNIQVHHILRHANHPTLRESAKNLICLCSKHHKQVTKREETYAPLLSSIVARKYK
jgi:5-methylcytosine-specific restriction endonuclease McrA